MRAAAAALALLVGACGSEDPGGGGNQGVSLLREAFGRLRAEPAPDVRAMLTRERLAASPLPILLAEFERDGLGTAFGLVPASADGAGVVQWRSADDRGLVIRGGMLAETQGFGFDLHAADARETATAFGQGGGQALTRIHRTLTPGGGISISAFVCDLAPEGPETLVFYGVAYPTTRWREDCFGTEEQFRNRFWIGVDGILRRSEQWAGPELGSVLLDRLVD